MMAQEYERSQNYLVEVDPYDEPTIAVLANLQAATRTLLEQSGADNELYFNYEPCMPLRTDYRLPHIPTVQQEFLAQRTGEGWRCRATLANMPPHGNRGKGIFGMENNITYSIADDTPTSVRELYRRLYFLPYVNAPEDIIKVNHQSFMGSNALRGLTSAITLVTKRAADYQWTGAEWSRR